MGLVSKIVQCLEGLEKAFAMKDQVIIIIMVYVYELCVSYITKKNSFEIQLTQSDILTKFSNHYGTIGQLGDQATYFLRLHINCSFEPVWRMYFNVYISCFFLEKP